MLVASGFHARLSSVRPFADRGDPPCFTILRGPNCGPDDCACDLELGVFNRVARSQRLFGGVSGDEHVGPAPGVPVEYRRTTQPRATNPVWGHLATVHLRRSHWQNPG